jgi:hypothetical protein
MAHGLLNWLAAGLIAAIMSTAYLLDGPSEIEAARAAAHAHRDARARAQAESRFDKAARQACGAENASWQLREDGALQCLTKRGHRTSVVAVQ